MSPPLNGRATLKKKYFLAASLKKSDPPESGSATRVPIVGPLSLSGIRLFWIRHAHDLYGDINSTASDSDPDEFFPTYFFFFWIRVLIRIRLNFNLNFLKSSDPDRFFFYICRILIFRIVLIRTHIPFILKGQYFYPPESSSKVLDLDPNLLLLGSESVFFWIGLAHDLYADIYIYRISDPDTMRGTFFISIGSGSDFFLLKRHKNLWLKKIFFKIFAKLFCNKKC